MSSQVVRVDGLRSLSYSSISSSYAPIGTGFGHPMRLFKIVNNTNADLTISFDGVNYNDFVPTGSFTLYDCTTNKNNATSTFVFQNGTQVYAKGSPTSGSVYVVVIFGRGE